MNRKSTTCISKKTHQPLTEYKNEFDAQHSADYANLNYKRNLVPYQCKKCSKWHLGPKDRQTPSKKCSHCTDSLGCSKALYFTYAGAKRRADIIMQEEGKSLQVYECPNLQGWHLTKGQQY